MGGKGSGRKSKDHNTAEIQKTMTEAGKYGAQLIRDFVRGKDQHGNRVSITMVKLTACLQAIAHGIGSPRQKLEVHHTGEQMSLKDIAKLAADGDNVPTIELPKVTKTEVN